MVSVVTALLAAVFGFMGYFILPVLATSASIQTRQKIGEFYLKSGAKCLKQFTFVRRVLSGYDILPINVDSEQKLLKVTLDSSTIGESNEYRFADPDNRILRLFNKPVALAYEKVPAAVDADLAEWGYWTDEKATDEGLWYGDLDDPESLRADPYLTPDSGLRLVDPVDAFNIVPNDVNPENVKTAEKITEERFSEYGGGIGIAQTVRRMMYFSVGAGAPIVMDYVNSNIIDSGGGPSVVENVSVGMVGPAMDTLVVVL